MWDEPFKMPEKSTISLLQINPSASNLLVSWIACSAMEFCATTLFDSIVLLELPSAACWVARALRLALHSLALAALRACSAMLL